MSRRRHFKCHLKLAGWRQARSLALLLGVCRGIAIENDPVRFTSAF